MIIISFIISIRYPQASAFYILKVQDFTRHYIIILQLTVNYQSFPSTKNNHYGITMSTNCKYKLITAKFLH